MATVVDPTTVRLYIVDSEHPHAGETGYLTRKVIDVAGKPMAELRLDHCRRRRARK